jgi:hypothetical protein
MGSGDRLHRDGKTPKVERVSGLPRQRRILWLNRWVEAVSLVNDADDDVESIGGANAGQVQSNPDLESAGNRRWKCADFGEIDHAG